MYTIVTGLIVSTCIVATLSQETLHIVSNPSETLNTELFTKKQQFLSNSFTNLNTRKARNAVFDHSRNDGSHNIRTLRMGTNS